MSKKIHDYFYLCTIQKASDIFLTANRPAAIRRNGAIQNVSTEKLTDEEKIAKGNELKADAKEMFKDKKFDDALSTYETALDYVQDLKEEAAKALVLSLRLNIAICGTKTKSYKKSVTQATKVLENEGPSNPKALYWRAVAKKKISKL